MHPDWEIRDEVDQLANHTAGGQIRYADTREGSKQYNEWMHCSRSLKEF